MRDLYAKCGFNCGRCPAFKENATTDEARQYGSDGWKKYFGFQIRYDRMYCDGCQTPDEENPILLDPRCKIRKCATLNGVQTCAHCSEYRPCMHDLKIFNPNVSRDTIEARIGAAIPEDGYIAFIAPYEHLKHLDNIHDALKNNDIVKVKASTVKVKIAGFPEDLSMSKEEASAFKSVHRILAAIASISGSSYAQKKEMEKRKLYLLKLLWAVGLYGEFDEENVGHLILDCETYAAQKLTANTDKVDAYFEILKGYYVCCEYLPLPAEKQDSKGWKTPTGWLRKTGWFLKISFAEEAGGISALKALKSYTSKLDENYTRSAFRYFKTCDMRILK